VIFILSYGDEIKPILSFGVYFCMEAHMSDQFRTEEFSVNGEQLLAKVKELIREGNIRRVIIKDKTGRVLVEFPLTIGVVGIAFAPVLAAVGAIAALVTEATVVVEKQEAESPK